MTQIEAIYAKPGVSAFFFDDQRAIADGANSDGFAYKGQPATPRFNQIREPGEALLVAIELDDGSVVYSDCAAVQYPSVGNRDQLFHADEHVSTVEELVANKLVGREVDEFSTNEAALMSISDSLHTAVEYGVSSALLKAAATARNEQMFEILADELGTQPATEPVDIFGQTGDARYRKADKMIMKGVDVLPHGLFNSIEKVGHDGEKLKKYVEWLSTRVQEIGKEKYNPRFHIDLYGMVEKIVGSQEINPSVLDYFEELAEAVAPYRLQIEEPFMRSSRAKQITTLQRLRQKLSDADVPVRIVADEWCDSLEDIKAFVDAGAADLIQVKTPDLGSIKKSGQAVQYCKSTDVNAYLGGTCNETEHTAKVSAHVALGTNAEQILAKPGMGFDEGHMIISNEMQRALISHRMRANN